MIHPFARFVFAVAAAFSVAPSTPTQHEAPAVVAVRQHTAFRHVGSGTVHVARPMPSPRRGSQVLPQLRLRR